MTAIEETTTTHMLRSEHTPIFDELTAQLGDPSDYRRMIEEEYNREHPKPRPPKGKQGVKRK